MVHAISMMPSRCATSPIGPWIPASAGYSGTARVAAATGNIVRALAAEVALEDLEVAELYDEDEDDDDA